MAQISNYELDRSKEIVDLGNDILNESIFRGMTERRMYAIQKRIAKLRDESGFYTEEASDILDELEEKGFFSFWQWNFLIPAYLA